MSALRTAIYNKFKADSNSALYVDLGGTRFYYYEAIQNPTSPYCVFHFPDEGYDFEFTERFEDTMVQFDYFSDKQSPNDCDKGIADIKSMYDFTSLTVTGDAFLKMERIFTLPPFKVQPNNVWQGVVRYSALVQTV